MEANIRLAAEALGQQLLGSAAYTAMQEAEEAALEDSMLQEQYREYALLRSQLQELMAQESPDNEEIASLSADIDRVQNGLQAMDNMDRLNQARGEFSQLMEDVNMVLQGILAPQDDMDEDFQGCGGGGCAGCSGCG